MQKTEVFYMLFDVLLFGTFFNKVGNIQKLLSRLWFFIHFHLTFTVKKQEKNIKNQQESSNSNSESDIVIRREEVEMVMERLGIFCSPESEKLSMGFDELSKLFDDEEPSLEEVKDAFDVFDVNRDGFIDELELQRVVCLLGLKEGSDVGNCRRMIRKFDTNGDGRIDFHEFVKFMQNNLC